MSTTKGKPLNQAFLRAYAKEQPGGVIPAPHAFGAQRQVAPRPAESSATRTPLATMRRDAVEHDDPSGSQDVYHQPSAVPAPHVSFPAVYAVATDDLSLPTSLLVSQIDATAVVQEMSPPVTKPAPQPTSRPQATWPHGIPAAHHLPAQSQAERVSPPPASGKSTAPAAKPAVEHTAEAAPSQPTFVAAWEVDQFGWNEECQNLFHKLAAAFDDTGEQLRSVTSEGLRVLAVSSTYRGEGRTIVATLLARAAARAGVRVALLDGDVENPQIATQLKVQLSADWVKVMNEGIPLEEVAVASLEDSILAFPLRPEARESVVLLNHSDFAHLLRRIAETVDLVIVDLGPFTNDQRRMFPAGKSCPIDAAIVVRDVRSTTEQQAGAIAHSLRSMGVEAVGICENFVRD